MNTYQLGIDSWEGQLEIDEATLKANGVKFMFIRLNDISGGLHKDTGFDKQWSEAAGFYRAPYFVFNPWQSGQVNYDWLNINMPAGAKLVALDIEVVYSGITPFNYSAEVNKFRALVAKKWRSVIYTGEWFLPNLFTWPLDASYWWAQYPYAMYPSSTQNITWDQLKAKINLLTRPGNEAKCPGNVALWQCSADKFILPGTSRPIDINVFFGDENQLAEFFGEAVAPPPIDYTEVLNKLNIILENQSEEAAALFTTLQSHIAMAGVLDTVHAKVEILLNKVDALVNSTPNPPPASSDGYIGPSMGIYKILDLPDMQTGNALTTIQDSYGGEVTIIMDKMVAWMEANCPGWSNFVNNGSVTHDADGYWRYEVKLIKGQLVRIAEVGGKTTANPLGNGRIIGMDSEGSPLRGAVNMDACSPTLTPWYFHKITGQPWYFPIVQPRQQPQMQALNGWWIKMAYVEKVS